MTLLKSAIIGLGQIGQGYDYNSDHQHFILTHAAALSTHGAYKLIAGVDTCEANRVRFEKKFHCAAYDDTISLLEKYHLDVVIIAVPTECHYKVFKEVLKLKPKAILCEKPLSFSLPEAKEMLDEAKRHQIILVVNYMRRFEPSVLKLKEELHNQKIGEIYKVIVKYSKGIFNNASHFIDLLIFLFGSVLEVRLIKKGRKWNNQDPEPDFYLRFSGIDAYFLAFREESFSVAEMEIFGSSGSIQYKNGGEKISIQTVIPDPNFSNYCILSPEVEVVSNGMQRYQWHVLENLYQYLMGKQSLYSSGQDALESLQVISKICKSE
jgi:predicted dehydrogenase